MGRHAIPLEEKVKSKIKKAGNNKNLLKIWYTDKKGDSTMRLTEPYEIRGDDYFGYCKLRNNIRRFKIKNINQANLSKKTYEPRWDIKVADYIDGMYKEAALRDNIQLYPHQKRVAEDPSTEKVLAHPVGSGKTLTAIAKFEKMKQDGKANRALVVVPSGLRMNFGSSGIKKFTNSSYNIVGNKAELSKKNSKYGLPDKNKDYNIVSYDLFKKDPEYYIRETGADTVITDESHKGKNEDTAVTEALKKTRKLYPNYIGLTGSVVSNSLADIQPLVDVASGQKHILGKNKKQFEQMWLKRDRSWKYRDLHEKRKPVLGFKNKRLLQNELKKYVDYLDVNDIKEIAKMPDKAVSITKVPLSKEQKKLYKGILKDNPAVRKMIRTKRLETLKDEEAAQVFSKLVEARKLMNDISAINPKISPKDGPKLTPKLNTLLRDMEEHLGKTPDGRAILFSHLIKGGTDSIEQGLKSKGIQYGKFTGKGNFGITEEGRQKDIEDFNKGNKKVMIISSAGGEGLSLNDTTWEGVLDPHYNPEKMKQMEARGVRSGGLSHRPKKDRVVNVNRYIATMPKFLGIFKSRDKTPDEFIYEIAQHKDKQNKLLFDTLKENNKVADYIDGMYKEAKTKSNFEKLKDNKVPLSKEEKEEVYKSKATWSNGDSAVWKSVNKDGKTTYVTHTHRACGKADTLKGAISKFHNSIKGTA